MISVNMTTNLLPMSSPFSGVDSIIDDSFENACCICLEPFSSFDPLTATKCKHDYHLHCILEWSQRSNECPICSHHLILKDPVSQELLAGVESDKNLRLKRNIHAVNQDNEVNNDASHVDVSDVEQRIIRQFATVATRARSISRRRRQSTLSAEPSQNHAVSPVANTSITTQLTSPLQERQSRAFHFSDMDPIASYRSPNDIRSESLRITPPYASASIITAGNTQFLVESSRSNPENSGKSTSSDFMAFSESLKSKISTASAKYKESISKSTRGLKEKLAARNDSVKELSRGVQREMSAGIAKMIERLDITQKRAGSSVPKNSPLQAKGKRDNTTIIEPLNRNTGAIAHDMSSARLSS